uniref:26S proteasome non-ATPase regulatory subunit 3 N-terminal TPR repeats domain-containing protein n=1 Tax=Paramormyrops kingsleyae TaxID=1676925 RepID=A0A3B3Q869_9TELE
MKCQKPNISICINAQILKFILRDVSCSHTLIDQPVDIEGGDQFHPRTGFAAATPPPAGVEPYLQASPYYLLKKVSGNLLQNISSHNCWVLDLVVAKCYYYNSRVRSSSRTQMSPQGSYLHACMCTSALCHNTDSQAFLLNLILNSSMYNRYDLVENLVPISDFPKQMHKHLIVVELLLEEIPDWLQFRQHFMNRFLMAYLLLTQSEGNLASFSGFLDQFRKRFLADGSFTFTLIICLRHNVIKTIESSIACILQPQTIPSSWAVTVLFPLYKANEEGMIKTSINHEKGCKLELVFHQRISFCLDTHMYVSVNHFLKSSQLLSHYAHSGRSGSLHPVTLKTDGLR